MTAITIIAGMAAGVAAADDRTVITMQISNPQMTINGTAQSIDDDETVPVIRNDRTLLPVRAFVEGIGGNVEWDGNAETVTLTHQDTEIKLTINSTAAYLNGSEQTLDTAPIIINDHTMFPIRFIAENFGYEVSWNGDTQTVTIAGDNSSEISTVHTNEFDLEKGTVVLNNGIEMPILGLGVNSLTVEQAEESVYNALTDGYRMIDTANGYRNERGVARGIERANVPREDFFITAKLWPSQYSMEGIDATLERLGLEYVDLLILHHPYGNYIEGYKAAEQAVAEGKARAIGLSNFNKTQIEEIMNMATIIPSVLQVEAHPYYQQAELMEYIDQYGIVLEAWYNLGGRGNTQTLFNDETILEIAKAHDKTAAQVILRWHLQSGHIAIPGSSNADHIQENFDIFDFELSDEEMSKMSELETGSRFFLPTATDEEIENLIMGLTMDFDAQ